MGPVAAKRYPLTVDDVQKQVFSRIDPLMNKDLFDDGGSDEETVVKDINSDKTENSKIEKVSLSKKQRERNYKSLQTMSQHLDTISCFNSEKDSPGWHALKPVVDGTSKNLPRFRDDAEEVETLKSHYSLEISRLSSENVVKTFDEDIETLELRKIDKEEIWKEDQSVFFSGLVDIFLTDRVGRMDLMSGLRNFARGEEVRKIQVNQESRRGSRFHHYLAQSDSTLEDCLLVNLCNTLVD